MIRKYILAISLLAPVIGIAQFDPLNDIDLRPQAFGFHVAGKVSSNLLTAPTRQNTLSAEERTFEEYNNFAAGVGAELDLTPIQHENFFYTYRHEWSVGLGLGTSYHYQLYGSEFGLGLNGIFLTYHHKSRFLNIVGHNPVAENSSTVSETVHYSKYSGIRHRAIGVKFDVGNGTELEVAYLMESFTTDQGRDPWQGALIRWEDVDQGWGLETMLFWNHAAYGYDFTNTTSTEEYSPTGFFFNLKATYKFSYRSNYGKAFNL